MTDVTEDMWIVCYIILNNKNQAITYVLLFTVMHAQRYVTPLQGGNVVKENVHFKFQQKQLLQQEFYKINAERMFAVGRIMVLCYIL